MGKVSPRAFGFRLVPRQRRKVYCAAPLGGSAPSYAKRVNCMTDPKPSPPLWRTQNSTRTGASATTAGGRLLVLILVAAVGVASLFVVLLTWMRPAPHPDFLPLWVLPDRDA